MRTPFESLVFALAIVSLGAAPVAAQVRTVDPNEAIDSDLRSPAPQYQNQRTPPPADRATDPNAPMPEEDVPSEPPPAAQGQAGTAYQGPAPQDQRGGNGYAARNPQEATQDSARQGDTTYHRDDLIAAGEGVFGKGAQGLGGIVEKILKEQGEPNAYIAGREASGAFVLGLRYGSGIMSHKVEGQMPVYWTGPSVGFDVGGDANKVFVLVYNLYDTQDLYHRFPQGEGHLYFVGGFSASYLRWGNVVLIPVRLGVGWRAGVNVGYMKFTRKSRWLPF
jgi:hypothetical protein